MLDVDGVIDQAAMNEVLLCLASSLSCYYIRSAHQFGVVLYNPDPLVPSTCRSCVVCRVIFIV